MGCIQLLEKMLTRELISQEDFREIISEIDRKLIYELDYQSMAKKRSALIYSELIEKALHPKRVSEWLDCHIKEGGSMEDFDFI